MKKNKISIEEDKEKIQDPNENDETNTDFSEIQNSEQAIDDFLSFLNNQKIKGKQNILPSEIGKVGAEVTKETLGLNIKQKIPEGVKLIFIIEKVDNSRGEIHVKVKAKKESIEKSKTIILKGYKKGNNDDISIVKDIAQKFPKTFVTKLTDKLPSEIGKENDKVTSEILGIEHHLKSFDFQNVDVSYQLGNIDDEEGMIKVTVTFEKNNKKNIAFINVTGFRTRLQELKKIMNEFGESINTKHSSLLPHWTKDDTPTSKNLGIKEPEKNGVTINYVVINNDKLTGIVTVKVIAEKDGEKAEKEIKVIGFKTRALQDQDDVNKVKSILKDVLITSKEDELPNWEINAEVSKKDLGIDWTLVAEETISFKITSTNKDTGIVNVVATIKKNDASETKNLKIKRFKTTEMKNNDDIKQYIEAFDKKQKLNLSSTYTNKLKYLQKILKNEWQIEEPNLNLNTSISYEVEKINQINGEVTLRATIKKGQSTQQFDVVISGFMKYSEYVNLLKIELKKIIKNQTTILNNKSASSIASMGQTLSASELGIKEFHNEKLAHDAKITYNPKTPDDKKGDLKVDVKIEVPFRNDIENEPSLENLQSFLIPITIEGFMNNKQLNEEEIKKILDNISEQKTTTLNKVLPHWDKGAEISDNDILGIDAIELKKDESIKYTIISSNKALGQVYVDVQINKGSEQMSKVIMIQGFKTLYQDNKEKLIAFSEKFSKNQNTKFINHYPTWAKKTFVSNEDLGIEVPKNIDEIVITWKIEQINQPSGTVNVKVMTKKDDVEGTPFFIKINGFITTEDYLTKLVKTWKSVLESQFTSHNKKLASEVASGDEEKTAVELGIKNIPKEILNDNDIEIIYKTELFDDVAGVLNANVEFIIQGRMDQKDDEVTIFNEWSYEILIKIFGFKSQLS